MSAGLLMGGRVALVLIMASLAPSVMVVFGATGKRPFFEQMNAGVIAFVGGLLAAMLIAYASFGGGMVAKFVDVLRAEYNRMPDAALQPMVDWMNTMLSSAGSSALQSMTVASFRNQISGVLDLMQQTYAQMMPGAHQLMDSTIVCWCHIANTGEVMPCPSSTPKSRPQPC